MRYQSGTAGNRQLVTEMLVANAGHKSREVLPGVPNLNAN
jgi:hypothetical protein